MSQTNVLVLVGSLRAGSVNRQLAETAVSAAPEGATLTVFEGLADVPFYNEDIDVEGASIPAVDALRSAASDADAFLLVTPEYNGSLSSALKNAVDWVSRPRGSAAIVGKPAAVLGASGSPRGAQWAREDGVRVLRIAGAHVLADTVGVGASFQAFHDGRLVDPTLDARLRSLLTRLTHEAEAVRDAA